MKDESFPNEGISVARALKRVRGPRQKKALPPTEKSAEQRVEFVTASASFYPKIRERGCHDTGDLCED